MTDILIRDPYLYRRVARLHRTAARLELTPRDRVDLHPIRVPSCLAPELFGVETDGDGDLESGGDYGYLLCDMEGLQALADAIDNTAGHTADDFETSDLVIGPRALARAALNQHAEFYLCDYTLSCDDSDTMRPSYYTYPPTEDDQDRPAAFNHDGLSTTEQRLYERVDNNLTQLELHVLFYGAWTPREGTVGDVFAALATDITRIERLIVLDEDGNPGSINSSWQHLKAAKYRVVHKAGFVTAPER